MGTNQNPRKRRKIALGPSSAKAYLDPHYWYLFRFSNEEHYEWFKDYSHFRHLIQAHIKPILLCVMKVLELGCGNSQLSEDLAVEKMQKRLALKGYNEIKVLEADMLNLPFSNECFDVVIEKGTMDVLFVDSENPWNPRPETVNKVMASLKTLIGHISGVLYSIPKFTWSVEWNTFGDAFHYFFYVLKKVRRRSLDGKVSSERVQPPSISLLHEELESEDYIFRTNIDEMNS
ncbi:hypothetical protein RGQ29_005363 [Quercus rubra]|uniref:Methyltransferase domain-containing protein n=1 Tax=Quercus rubra TaxID=3512 RepID=A0AAN7IAM5_QUERU|nr:hypothetical protein RGQ29_005363 [Quercus rubra]